MAEASSDILRYAGGELVEDATGESAAWPRFGVIGDPIAHSLSPRLHAAALRERGSTDSYSAIRVESAGLPEFLDAALTAGMRGINVTLPHKSHALAYCRRRSEEADAIGASNTLVARGGGWQAHNTDARGLSLALERAVGRELPRFLERAVIIGAGGAARAAAYSLHSLGVRTLFVLARSSEKARWVETAGWGSATVDPTVLDRATTVIHCTPLGWREGDPSPIDPSRLEAGCLVADMVYASSLTPLLAQAEERNCITLDGLAMLVAQAALAFAMWHGATAPLDVMATAVGLRWRA
jgi:shikimate dehydrogenase